MYPNFQLNVFNKVNGRSRVKPGMTINGARDDIHVKGDPCP